MCMFHLSKFLMHEFHHDYIENKYGNKSRLLFTDADNLMNEIKTEVVCEQFLFVDFFITCWQNERGKS